MPEEGKKFSVAMFPIEQMHKETISKLYTVKRKEDDVIARISRFAVLYVRDLKSVLPPHLLSDTSSTTMPWLTDNAVNCRIAQIAEETNDTKTCRVMHPQIKSLGWIQCDLCQKWLHADCAGISLEAVTAETSFSCGCDTKHVHTFEKTRALLKQGWFVDIVIEDQEILNLNEGLKTGAIRSNRMFLFKHPTFSPKLKMKLSEKLCFFMKNRFQAEMALQSNFALE